MMRTSCGSFLKALLYDCNLNRNWITLCYWSKIVGVLLQVRCHCTSGVGWYVWKDVEWALYIEPTYSVCGCVRYVIV